MSKKFATEANIFISSHLFLNKIIDKYFTELISVLLVLLFYGFKSPNIGALFNSDALYLPILVADLIQGSRFSDWHLTPSPYFFPDFIFFYLITLAGVKGYWAVVSFTLIQVLIYSFFLRNLFRQLDFKEPEKLHLVSLIIFLTMAITLGKTYQYILISAHHFSVVAASILIFYFIFKSPLFKSASVVLSLIISFLMGLSDSLFIIQFTIPLVAASFLVWLIRRESKFVVISTLLLFISILGYLAYPLFVSNPMRYSAKIGLLKFATLFSDYNSLSKVDRANMLQLGLLFFVVVGALVRFNALKIWFRSGNINLCLLNNFVFFSILLNSIIIALTTNLEASDRYYIPMAAVSSIYFALLLIRIHWFGVRWFIFLIAVILSARFTILYEKNGFAFDYEGAKVRCLSSAIDEFSLKFGVSEYWDAKKYQFLTNKKIVLAQFTYDGNPYYWITSSKFFNNSFTFILVSDESVEPNKINYEAIFNVNGMPSNSRRCANTTLYVYDKSIKLGS